MTFSVPYDGLRYREAIAVQRRSFFSDGTFWDAPLPDNAAIAPSSASAVEELDGQSRVVIAGNTRPPNLNTTRFSAEVVVIPGEVLPALQRVTLIGQKAFNSPALGKRLFTGFPIPEGFEPTADGDRSAVFVMPDLPHPQEGRGPGWYGELWQMRRPDPATGITTPWVAQDGGVMVDLHRYDKQPGYYQDWTSGGYKGDFASSGDFFSTHIESNWGATGSGLPLGPGIITVEDLRAGAIQHAVGLVVSDAARGSKVWPATRTDGGAAVGSNASRVREGMRFRFLPDAVMPDGMHFIAQWLWAAVRKYGFVVVDRTLDSLAVRAEPAVAPLHAPVPGWQVLSGFPWTDLRQVAVGSKWVPTPLAP